MRDGGPRKERFDNVQSDMLLQKVLTQLARKLELKNNEQLVIVGEPATTGRHVNPVYPLSVITPNSQSKESVQIKYWLKFSPYVNNESAALQETTGLKETPELIFHDPESQAIVTKNIPNTTTFSSAWENADAGDLENLLQEIFYSLAMLNAHGVIQDDPQLRNFLYDVTTGKVFCIDLESATVDKVADLDFEVIGIEIMILVQFRILLHELRLDYKKIETEKLERICLETYSRVFGQKSNMELDKDLLSKRLRRLIRGN